MKNSQITPLVSVIVPVYHVEPYLKCCLDSLCNQSLSDIEVILVDDASPDSCGAICEEYAANHAHFVVLHQPENKGLSAARNVGISHASGEFLMFVDSDDWVHLDFCKTAYEYANRHQADIVMFNYKKITTDIKSEQEAPKVFNTFREGYHDSHEAMDMILASGGNAAWNKIYRRCLFDNISYPEGFLYEDTGTTYKLVHKASRFCFLDKVLYYQRIRPGSITTSGVSKKVLHDRAILNSQRYRDLVAWSYQSEMLDYRFAYFALWYCVKAKKDRSNPDYVYITQTLRSYKKCPKGFSGKMRLLFYLYKYSPLLFDLLFSMKGGRV